MKPNHIHKIKDEIENLMNTYKDQDYDIIQMHSWCGDSKNYWEKKDRVCQWEDQCLASKQY
jgi:hypothetical protein